MFDITPEEHEVHGQAGIPNSGFPIKIVVTEPDGAEPDLERIVESEKWAGMLNLIPSPKEYTKPRFVGAVFALDSDGDLLLVSDGRYGYAPPGRFLVHVEILG